MDQIHLDPQDKLPPHPPHPSDTLSTKHPPPTGQKSVCAPPPRIISGTALRQYLNFTRAKLRHAFRLAASLNKDRSRKKSWYSRINVVATRLGFLPSRSLCSFNHGQPISWMSDGQSFAKDSTVHRPPSALLATLSFRAHKSEALPTFLVSSSLML